MIKSIGQHWFIVNAPNGAFHGYPWPTYQDAQDALTAVLQGDVSTQTEEYENGYDYNYTPKDQYAGRNDHWNRSLLPIALQRKGEEYDDGEDG